MSKSKRQVGQTRKLTQFLKNKALQNRGMSSSSDYQSPKKMASMLESDIDQASTVKAGKSLHDTKWTVSDPEVNKIYRNYGVMLDFFDYSGVRI